jgi:hypothetical protein
MGAYSTEAKAILASAHLMVHRWRNFWPIYQPDRL